MSAASGDKYRFLENTQSLLSLSLVLSLFLCHSLIMCVEGGGVKHRECVKLCTPLFETEVSSYVSSSSGMEAAE